MLYRYDKRTLRFVKVKNSTLLFRMSAVLIFMSVVMGWSFKPRSPKDFTESEIMLVVNKYNEFSEEKFVEKLKSLNFRFPHIVYAQAKLETGDFKSKMFRENNNLFGMKEATKRINTASGTQNEHAYYETWSESLYDYALYSSTYLSALKSERDYFDYLAQNYAEDTSYVNKLKGLIDRERLKSKFN